MPLASLGICAVTWQAAAAWVGAGLGVLNFLIALISSRPSFTFECQKGVAGEVDAQLRITNTGNRPLLIRRVRIWSKCNKIVASDHADLDTDRTGIRRTMLAHQEGRFLKVIQPGNVGSIQLVDMSRGDWCFVLIRWSQQPSSLPWTPRLITRGLCRDIFDAVDPRPQ